MRRMLDLTLEEFTELKKNVTELKHTSYDLLACWELGVALKQIIEKHNRYNQSARKFFDLINKLELAKLKLEEDVVFAEELPLKRTL